jgi:hypothetical protein
MFLNNRRFRNLSPTFPTSLATRSNRSVFVPTSTVMLQSVTSVVERDAVHLNSCTDEQDIHVIEVDLTRWTSNCPAGFCSRSTTALAPQAMKPRSCEEKLTMLGVIVGILASGTPNHRTSVATYWSDETSGMNRPPPTSLAAPMRRSG